ncbi:MAG: xanthine dehydrogenase family protein molybdopterin-binding subunit [Candidatus Eiseniibacteriota bacterium]
MSREPAASQRSPHGVGARVPLIDGASKVNGTAVYTDDIRLPGMLTGKILRSPLPHARIVSIDSRAAEALPGVRAVVTGDSRLAQFGVLPISKDEVALAVGKVIYIGDCVAGVAADDEESANAACEAIRVEYEELPAFLKAEDALKQVPKELKLHPETRHATNLQKEVRQEFGDAEGALARSAHVATGEFRFVGVTHAFTEPHCVIAHWEPTGRLTVWSATQVPHYLHRDLALVLGMPMHRVRVIRPMVGGAFGGKSDPFPHEMIAALLSRKTGRPVRIRFDREEVFLTNHGRHPTKTKITVGADAEGRITALDLDALIDGGAWGSFGVVTTYYNGVLSVGPYRLENFRYRGRRVYTNKPPCGAMRGHGAVNSRFAYEVLIDELAQKTGVDAAEFRLKNLLPSNTTTLNGFRITSNGTEECIRKVVEASGWKAKRGRLPYGEGIGLACGFYISGSALRINWNRVPQSTVHLKIDMDGGITVHCMAAEIGQGSDTMLAQCVAEVLGVPVDWIRVFSRDSDTDPIDLGSYSSRVTFMAGTAARKAAEVIREKLCRAAARLTGRDAGEFDTRMGRVVCLADPAVSVSYFDAVLEAISGTGALISKGCYHDAPTMGGSHKGAAAGLSPSYSFQAYISQVKVDPETGFIRPAKVWAAHDCGKALNPLAVEMQIEGCLHMGMGQALMEEFGYNKLNVLNGNLLDYKIPSSLEMPDVEVFIVESNDPEGPFGAKEAGEGPLLPILPSLANAVTDAVGVRLYELPMSPDRVLAAIERKARADALRESRSGAKAAEPVR